MTPKERYDAHKAKLRELDHEILARTEHIMLLDLLDRFVTAVERIAEKDV